MNKQLTRQLDFIVDSKALPLLATIQRGIEKEGLRVTPDGSLAPTPHPAQLGSALSNPYITTDFSENLLEFITPVFTSVDETLAFLDSLHRFTYQNIDDELIWASSMPCVLPADASIPLAQYGSSNIGTMKTVYRRGLGHRYGRAMQMVAGLHYNFSLPDALWPLLLANSATPDMDVQDFKTQQYLNLIRNFRRYYWLLIYLFGAAPAVHDSFVAGRPHTLATIGDHTLGDNFATSLRMGDLGYQSDAQQSLFVCYNELQNYIDTLGSAMHTAFPHYQQFGLEVGGEFQQLSTALLQIENEFYSPIRPKRVTSSGEKPLQALQERGIEYIEVRCLDIDPYAAVGIDASTIRFLDSFLLFCLLQDSPLCDRDEFAMISDNQARVVNAGLDPAVTIFSDKKELPMRDCAARLLTDIAMVADTIDQAEQLAGEDHNRACRASIEQQIAKLDNPELTPARKIASSMAELDGSHLNFALQQSSLFADQFISSPLDDTQCAMLAKTARDSLAKQHNIEQSDTQPFKQFLQHYFA